LRSPSLPPIMCRRERRCQWPGSTSTNGSGWTRHGPARALIGRRPPFGTFQNRQGRKMRSACWAALLPHSATGRLCSTCARLARLARLARPAPISCRVLQRAPWYPGIQEWRANPKSPRPIPPLLPRLRGGRAPAKPGRCKGRRVVCAPRPRAVRLFHVGRRRGLFWVGEAEDCSYR
jgi:hypothetical protein